MGVYGYTYEAEMIGNKQGQGKREIIGEIIRVMIRSGIIRVVAARLLTTCTYISN